MRVGLVARADRTGLAAQTWCFWRNMRPTETLIVDLSHCSGQQPEVDRYDSNFTVWKARVYPSVQPKSDPVLEDFLDKVDVVFTCETPYNLWLFKRAREKGVRTVLQPNYEFLDYLAHKRLPEPDVFALPSLWHETEIRQHLPGRDIRYLPVPVDRTLLPYRHRPELRSMLHTAGTPAMEDRNGTLLLMEAMTHVRSPVQLTIRTQKHLPRVASRNVKIDSRSSRDFWELYGDEDLFVMPRKFGGLCLPMQEALSVGMPVLTTNIDPNQFMPRELLVDAPVAREVMTRTMISVHEADPAQVAARIDWLYEHPERFSELSEWADVWAVGRDWETMRPLYEEVLAG